MARMRNAMDKKPTDIRKAYNKLNKKQKKEFSFVFDKTNDMNLVLTFKSKQKQSRTSSGDAGDFSRGELLTHFGWRPEISSSPFGLRQTAKVEAIISWCTKMGESNGSGRENNSH